MERVSCDRGGDRRGPRVTFHSVRGDTGIEGLAVVDVVVNTGTIDSV